MNIWLLHVGEDLPIDESPRLFRYGHLAEALIRRGHRVTRWAPTFHHYRKHERRPADTDVEVRTNYTIRLVHADGYRRNVSLARIRSYRQLARGFTRLAAASEPPQIIVSGIPSLEWCTAAVDFGQQRGIPVVIDVRDLWPDVYLNALSRRLRPLGRWALAGMYRRTGRMLAGATALAAVSQTYLDWALVLARRGERPLDRVVPLGYELPTVPAHEVAAATNWLIERGVDPTKTICVFAGSFERSYDVAAIVRAAEIAYARGHHELQFVLCGDGGKMPAIREQAAGLTNVVLLGWVDPARLAAVQSMARIGLAAYAADALQSLPNKVYEYLAHGLAVVSSLRGEAAALLESHRCGVSYPAGDAAALCDRLVALCRAGSPLESMRTSARTLWQTTYRSRDVYDRFAGHLEAVVGQCGARIRGAA